MSEQAQAPAEDTSKRPWHSKTMWMAALSAVAVAAFPPAAAWIAANPVLYSFGVSGVFAGLRWISNGAISFGDDA